MGDRPRDRPRDRDRPRHRPRHRPRDRPRDRQKHAGWQAYHILHRQVVRLLDRRLPNPEPVSHPVARPFAPRVSRRGLQLARLGVASLCPALPLPRAGSHRPAVPPPPAHLPCLTAECTAFPAAPDHKLGGCVPRFGPSNGVAGCPLRSPPHAKGGKWPAALAGHFWGTRLPRWSASA